MPSDYPGGFDTLNNPPGATKMNDPGTLHSEQHANANDAIEAIEGTLGINPQGTATTVAERLAQVELDVIVFAIALGD